MTIQNFSSSRLGERTKTKVLILYLYDVANPDTVAEVNKRLEKISIDGIIYSGYISEMIKDHRLTFFPLVQETERPDKVAASILEGRIAIIVDKSPFTLIVLATSNEFYQYTIFIFVVSGIGTYGAAGILRYSWPVMELTMKANIPYLMQTTGLFFAVSYFPQICLAIAGLYYALALATTQLLEILNYKWFVLLWFPIIMFLIHAPPSVVDIRFLFDYLRAAGFLVVFILPFLIWLLAVLLKRGDTSGAK